MPSPIDTHGTYSTASLSQLSASSPGRAEGSPPGSTLGILGPGGGGLRWRRQEPEACTRAEARVSVRAPRRAASTSRRGVGGGLWNGPAGDGRGRMGPAEGGEFGLARCVGSGGWSVAGGGGAAGGRRRRAVGERLGADAEAWEEGGRRTAPG